jgi:hypothetical protein
VRLLPQKALHAALGRLRRDPTAGATDHNFFSTLSGRSGLTRILVHVFIIYFYCLQT